MTDTERAFELRTYIAVPGKRDELLARFRDRTMSLFERHGMTNHGYWTVSGDADRACDTVVYLLSHQSRAAAERSWAAFAADPDWIAARDASSELLTESFTSVFLTPTAFSPLR